jgi:hypothetical protein
MLKSFTQFISESENLEQDFIKSTAAQLIQKIKSADESGEYTTFSGMEFTKPFRFDLILNVRKEKNAKISEDSHFNSLSWEQINYDKLGYAIDANSRTNKGDLLIPEIEIHLILDPTKIPMAYTNLYSRLVDILTHETNHIAQFDQVNRDPFSSHTSNKEERNSAKKSFKYFLLNDEVESMVEGMYASSKVKEIPLDHVFHDYLTPFIQSKYITPEEYSEVLSVWVKAALEKYPDAIFSKKVEKIVNSI